MESIVEITIWDTNIVPLKLIVLFIQYVVVTSNNFVHSFLFFFFKNNTNVTFG